MGNPLIAVDVDGVIADLMTPWLYRVNETFGTRIIEPDVHKWDWWDLVRGAKSPRDVYHFINDPAIYDEVKPYPGAVNFVRDLRKIGEVVFVTSAAEGTEGRKFKWLCDLGLFPSGPDPLLSYIEARNKRLIATRYLIDDHTVNTATALGTGITLARPWNVGGVNRYETYEDILQFIVEDQENPWKGLELAETNAAIADPAHQHITEMTRPIQTRAFRELLDKMYQVHLDKNADYSPANILGTGEIGLATRVWDKVSRLMNLIGYRIEIASTEYVAPMEPKNESIEDNVMDLAVYAIIWKLLRDGKWGK